MEYVVGVGSSIRSIASVLLLSSAISMFAQETKEVNHKLAKERFDLSSFMQKETGTLLDTLSIYVRFDPRPTLFSKGGKYQVLRFYDNGKVQIAADSVLSSGIDRMVHTAKSKMDYYVVERDNKIKLEIYRDALADNGWWSGKVYSDSIVFDKVNNTKQTFVFKRRLLPK